MCGFKKDVDSKAILSIFYELAPDQAPHILLNQIMNDSSDFSHSVFNTFRISVQRCISLPYHIIHYLIQSSKRDIYKKLHFQISIYEVFDCEKQLLNFRKLLCLGVD